MVQAAGAERSNPTRTIDNAGLTPAGRATATAAADLVARSTDPSAGTVDTRQLAGMIVDAARSDPAQANAAYDAIEQQLGTADRVQDGARMVDVVGTRADVDPRLGERIEVESKVSKTSLSGDVTTPATPKYEVAKDAQRLADNRAIRTQGLDMEVRGPTLARGGEVLAKVGRVARPIGMVMDAVELGSAFKADGNTVGENTGRAASGLAGGAAGGWGGAAVGAAIGTAVFPGVGTAGRGAFDTIKNWF